MTERHTISDKCGNDTIGHNVYASILPNEAVFIHLSCGSIKGKISDQLSEICPIVHSIELICYTIDA